MIQFSRGLEGSGGRFRAICLTPSIVSKLAKHVEDREEKQREIVQTCNINIKDVQRVFTSASCGESRDRESKNCKQLELEGDTTSTSTAAKHPHISRRKKNNSTPTRGRSQNVRAYVQHPNAPATLDIRVTCPPPRGKFFYQNFRSLRSHLGVFFEGILLLGEVGWLLKGNQ